MFMYQTLREKKHEICVTPFQYIHIRYYDFGGGVTYFVISLCKKKVDRGATSSKFV